MLIYKEVEREDEDVITEMYETYLNAGNPIRGHVREGLQCEDYMGYKCVDTETGKLVGIISAKPGLDFTCGHPELVEQIHQKWGTQGLYSSDIMIVDPAYRKHGIARELAIQLKKGLMEKHAVCLVMELWIRSTDGDVPALHPLRDIWEMTTLTIDREFYKNLADYGLTCPLCGAECHCGAMITVMEFHYPPTGGEHDEETKD